MARSKSQGWRISDSRRVFGTTDIYVSTTNSPRRGETALSGPYTLWSTYWWVRYLGASSAPAVPAAPSGGICIRTRASLTVSGSSSVTSCSCPNSDRDRR